MSDLGEYAKLKVADLKKLLKNEGLSVTGNKTELIERLQKHTTTNNGHLDSSNVGDDEEFDEEAILGDEEDIDLDKILPHEEESVLLGTNSASSMVGAKKKITLKRSELSLSSVTKEETSPEEEPQVDSTPEEDLTPPTKKAKLSTESEEPVHIENKLEKVKLKSLESDEDRKAARLARFGNSLTTPSSKISSGEPLDVDTLKKRADRFGEITSKTLSKPLDVEKLKKRAERFGEVTSGTLTKVEVSEKLKQRQERFSESTEITSKTTNTDVSADDKKAARAQRFAAA